MIRQILCRSCGDSFDLDREDKRMGFQMRKRYLACVTPRGHGLTVNGVFNAMAEVVCDGCTQGLQGDIAVAVTQWNIGREAEPGNWEQEYGNVITKEVANAADTLKGQPK